MSHYPTSKTYSQIKKYPQDKPPTFLNKKRTEAEMDYMSNKRHFDYDDHYDHYDHYEKNYDRSYDKGDKYYPPKYRCSPYSNGFHGGGNLKNYRGKDYYYSNHPQYHNSNYTSNKSPRRDYKKPFQKYGTDTDGVRNLSHCELPSSPNRKKDDHPENRKDELYPEFNYVMNRLPQGQFTSPQQPPPYQQIYQNQQNISIKIIQKPYLNSPYDKRPMTSNMSSSYMTSGYSKRRYSNQYDSSYKDSDKNNALKLIQQGSNESSTRHSQEHRYESKIPKPKITTSFQKTNISLIEKPKNLFEKGPNLPLDEYKPLSSSLNSHKYMKTYTNSLELEPNYLLSKIPNKKLVSNFVNISMLNNEKYEDVVQSQESKKSFLVYDDKYENEVKKFTECNAAKKENLRKQIEELMKTMDKNENETRNTKTKVYLAEWKSEIYNAQIEAVDKILEENTKKN